MLARPSMLRRWMLPRPLVRMPSIGSQAGPSPAEPLAATTLSLAPAAKIGSSASAANGEATTSAKAQVPRMTNSHSLHFLEDVHLAVLVLGFESRLGQFQNRHHFLVRLIALALDLHCHLLFLDLVGAFDLGVIVTLDDGEELAVLGELDGAAGGKV